ncbi:MAG: EAL domain-containing protein [Proteobacteria bacterium]|nr:EAL domain-containing protein [Pseudomonadota bacterium]
MPQSSEPRRLFFPLDPGVIGLRGDELRETIGTAAIFGVVAYLSVAFTPSGGVAMVSPSNGILLAALLLVRRTSCRGAILVFSMIADIFATTAIHHTLWTSIGLSLIDGLEILIAFSILESRERLPFHFKGIPSLLSFSMAVFAASAAAAVLSGTVCSFSQKPVDAHSLFSLFAAHLLGLFTVTPALIRFLGRSKAAHPTPSFHERFGLLGLLVVLPVIMIVSYQSPFGFVILPILVAVAYRLGPKDTSAAVLLLSTTVLICSALGFDPSANIAPTSLLSGPLILQLRILTTVFTVMLLAETIASQARLRARLSAELARRSKLNCHLKSQEEALTLQKAELERAHNRLKEAINILPEGMVILDADNRYVAWNRRYAEIYSQTADLLSVGGNVILENGLHPGAADREDASLADKSNLPVPADPREHFLDGRYYLVEEKRTSEGGLISLQIDITDIKKRESSAVYMSRHDALTSLPNRHVLTERMHLATTCEHRGEGMALLLLDLDNFKTVNDTLGHAAGDELLQAVADRLRNALRESDTVARLGGDEFAVLVKVSQPETAGATAARILNVLKNPVRIGGKDVVCSASIGIAITPDHSSEAIELFRLADLALYAAKEMGRGTYRIFEPELDIKFKAKAQLETEVREAIIGKQFEIHYQLITCLSTLKPIGAEALVRWSHPRQGSASTADFIMIAEEIGLISELGAEILRRACFEAVTWPDEMSVSVNVTATELEADSFIDTVKSALADSGLAGDRLIIEVTESTVMKDVERSARILRNIRELGVEVAMDDFGTGYSSLGSLAKVPFQKIKIDRSFVRDLAASPEARAILATIVDLAKTLGMTTTAEGIETAEQLSIVKDYGCTLVQGYLFHRPQQAEQVRALLWNARVAEQNAA